MKTTSNQNMDKTRTLISTCLITGFAGTFFYISFMDYEILTRISLYSFPFLILLVSVLAEDITRNNEKRETTIPVNMTLIGLALMTSIKSLLVVY